MMNENQNNQEQTIEEYLLSQLDATVTLKDGSTMLKPDGTPMTKKELIATSILNNAMQGDLKAAQYIQMIQQMSSVKKKTKKG